MKRYIFKDHPERQPDEVWLGMFDDERECGDGTDRTRWGCIGWTTRRQGNALPNGSFPVFVKQDEIRRAKDGEKILANLLPVSEITRDIIISLAEACLF